MSGLEESSSEFFQLFGIPKTEQCCRIFSRLYNALQGLQFEVQNTAKTIRASNNVMHFITWYHTLTMHQCHVVDN